MAKSVVTLLRTAFQEGGENPINQMASYHIDISSSAFGIQEENHFPPVVREMFPRMAEIRKGYLYGSGRPGLGLDIDERVAAKFPLGEIPARFPRVRKEARPPRTLPWQDVKRILRSIMRSEPPGKRDFAILLLLATYGMGAAEVLGLRLQDVDWKAGVLRARRPKTKVSIELPLLPPIRESINRIPALGTPTCQGHCADVPPNEHALPTDDQRSDFVIGSGTTHQQRVFRRT